MNLPPESLAARLARTARERQEQQRERHRRPFERLPGQRLRWRGRTLHDFSSNDYLGLAHGTVRGASGSGASALVSGYGPQHQDLEDALAAWLGREAALLTSSGFLANLAVLSSLAGRGDTVVQDRLCHASLIDGARLSGATLSRYPHGDVAAAGRQLARTTGGHRLLVTDGVFSMDGDTAPVRDLAALARETGATLVVDDAHGLGVLGETGAGICEQQGLDQDDVPVLVGTLGKAFGTAGAFIAGSRELVTHVENVGRSVIYSTALPPVVAQTALDRLPEVRSSTRRNRLADRIAQFRRGARALHLDLLPSNTPIQPVLLGDESRVLAVAAALEEKGFLVGAIRPPTVPPGTSRLRITLSAEHEPAQVDALLAALGQVLEPGVP